VDARLVDQTQKAEKYKALLSSAVEKMKANVQVVVSSPSLNFQIGDEQRRFRVPEKALHEKLGEVIQGELLPKFLEVVVMDEKNGQKAAMQFAAKFQADMTAEINAHVVPLLYHSAEGRGDAPVVGPGLP